MAASMGGINTTSGLGTPASKANAAQAAAGRTAGVGGGGSNTQQQPASDPLQALAQLKAQSMTPTTSGLDLSGAGLNSAGYSPTDLYSVAASLPVAQYGGGPGATTADASGNLGSWIAQAEKDTGVNPAQWTAALNLIAQHESGGSPTAVNNWDSNAAAGHPSEGVMQTIAPTYNQYLPVDMRAGNSIFNPVDNIAAAIEYIIARYGNPNNVPGVRSVNSGGSYVGY